MKIRALSEAEFDDKLKSYIQNKLLPMLREWGLDLQVKSRESSTQINYIGMFTKSQTYVGMNFSTSSSYMEDWEGKVFCTVIIDGMSAKSGTLTGTDPETDFQMITATIEEDLEYDYEGLEGAGA